MKQFLSTNQQLLLRLLYTKPAQSFYMREIGQMLGKQPGVFQRTLNGLVGDGLVVSEYRGHARFFRANTAHPLYPELKKLIAKTAGIESALRDLVNRVSGVKLALLYGSIAKGRECADSDIDLLVVGDPRVDDRLVKELPPLERALQREIHYTLYSQAEFREKRAKGDPFLKEVLTDRVKVLKGSLDAV